jgi:hypothetical protein
MAEKEPTGAERRQFPRYAILIEGEVRPALTGTGVFRVASSNISLGGIVLHAVEGEILQENDLVDISFPAVFSPDAVHLKGRVVWKARNQYKHLGNWSFGILFYGTPESEIRRIVDPAEAATMAGNVFSPEVLPPDRQ